MRAAHKTWVRQLHWMNRIVWVPLFVELATLPGVDDELEIPSLAIKNCAP